MIRKTVLTAIALLTLLCVRAQAEPTPEHVIKETIVKHSLEMDVDPALALSIAKKESGFKHELKSPYGAVGVFQLLPSTAKKMGFNPYYLSENKVNKDDIIEIEKEGKIFKCIYYTGNKVLDIVLLEKSLNCLNNDISFLTMADGNLLNFISSNHIYSMFSNLLDKSLYMS